MTRRETSTELFKYRDSLYSCLVVLPQGTLEDQIPVFDILMDLWLDANLTQQPFLADVGKFNGELSSTLFFLSHEDRSLFEEWMGSLRASEMIPSIMPEFDVNGLLDNEESLNIAGRVTHAFPEDYRYNSEDFIEENYEVCEWLVKHAKTTKGNRIWYDYDRSCFFFEDGKLAVNFKLKFTVDEQLDEPKRVKPNSSTRSAATTKSYTDYNREWEWQKQTAWEDNSTRDALHRLMKKKLDGGF